MNTLTALIISFTNHVQQIRDFFLDLIFPLTCLSCGQEGKTLCKVCSAKIILNKNFSCPHCKKPNEYGTFCNSCQTNYNFQGLWISLDYHDPLVAQLIKNLKYSLQKDIAQQLAHYMLSFWQQNNLAKTTLSTQSPLLIPVPLHKRKLKFRGFNQAELLARNIADQTGWILDTKHLIRQRFTKSQAKLNKKQRLLNVHKAFAWQNSNDITNCNIILIDDVASTGATLNNCAQTLRTQGVKNIWAWVVAQN